MQPKATPADAAGRHRPKTLTVFAAAFAAGAVLAYGVNRVVDVHVVQVEPQVESEPIFVALRSMPQGSPVTVWDVALKDWPKALLPTTALKADASLEGMVLRHPVREGQPLLSVQLVRDGAVLPGSAVAALPEPPRAAAVAAPERFLAAPPAEPSAAAVAAPPVIAPVSEATRATDPVPVAAAGEPSAFAVAAAVPAPEHDVAAETGADVEPSIAATPREAADAAAPGAAVDAAAASGPPLIAVVAPPASTDVDAPVVPTRAEPIVEPVAAPRAEPVVALPSTDTPTLAAADAAGAEPTPFAMVAVPTAPAAPLVAPVPALPSTDLARPLADVGKARPAPVAAAPTASVLDRTTAAEPPAATPTMPRHHLVIPERIALAADASFTQQPQRAGAAPTAAARGTTPSRDAAAAGAASAARTGARKPAAAKPSGRKPTATSAQPSARPQPSPARGLNAWLPNLSGGSRQR